jgi:hypothetical protein
MDMRPEMGENKLPVTLVIILLSFCTQRFRSALLLINNAIGWKRKEPEPILCHAGPAHNLPDDADKYKHQIQHTAVCMWPLLLQLQLLVICHQNRGRRGENSRREKRIQAIESHTLTYAV